MATAKKIKTQSVGYYRYNEVILGRGSFATVYLARHKIIGCEVALKVTNTNAIEEEYVFKNLEREANILKELHHPNIIRLYETVKSVNLYCLSLELIRGVNLYKFLVKQEGCRISERLARVFFYQILSAVEYMHDLRIMHRDLKLENILVEFGHVIKIVDFGLSNTYYPSYRVRTHCGSVEYAAPELFRSMSAYGLAADLWSLGVVLYAMVVGKMPFLFSREELSSGETTAKRREKFLLRIANGLMQENWELMEDLSPECWNLLHDLLKPDQFRRIQVKAAINHLWITKDHHLENRLTQKRKDLERMFHPEITEYLADMLKISKLRIEKQINVGHYNNIIASMFYIMRDILVKEVLYPPSDFKNSFRYRFEGWKQNKASFFAMYYSFNKHEKSSTRKNAKQCITYSDKCLLPRNDEETNEESTPSSRSNRKIKNETDAKSLSDSHSQEVKLAKSSIDQTGKSTHKADHTIETEDDGTKQRTSNKPFKSYKNSRPGNIKKNLPDEILHDANILLKQLQLEKNPNAELKTKRKDVHNIEGGNSAASTSLPTPNERQKTSTFTKLNKDYRYIPKTAEKKVFNAKNITSSSGGMSNFKNAESRLEKTEIIKKIMKNPIPRETMSNKILVDPAISLLTRTQRPVGETGRLKMAFLPKTPSKIPIKNMRYGPPAPFSQSAKTIKVKRATVADRINQCRGDTNEKDAKGEKETSD